MATKKILGIDLDGTLTKSIEEFLSPNMKARFIKLYNKLAVGKMNKVEEKVVKKGMKFYFNRKWKNISNIKLIDENIPEYLKELSKKYEIKIITSTYGDIQNVYSWLLLNNMNYDIINVKPDKKKDYCDILIEDRIDVLNFLPENKKGILFTNNREYIQNKKNIVALNTWKEIFEYLI